MIVVTGDRGFIGSELKQHLVAAGHKVHSLDWADRGKTWDTGGDPIEWIFHMGAISETNVFDWDALVRKNIQDTQAWIRFADEHGCGITYASSASVYGPWSNSPEWGPFQPQHPYGVSKITIDMWCAEQKFRVPVQGMRFFNVYGRNEGHKNQPSPVRRYIESAATTRKLMVWHHNGKLGSRDFISVDDCIHAMLRLKDLGVSGVYNIGTGQQLTFEDIARMVQKQFGIESVQVYVTPMPDHMIEKYQWESRANLNKLLSVLPDWNPLSVEQWLDANFETLYNKILEEIK
jgi:ADP-L-glycero-D-manno-heptose 6-epimerase